jgi:hypothetical protein
MRSPVYAADGLPTAIHGDRYSPLHPISRTTPAPIRSATWGPASFQRIGFISASSSVSHQFGNVQLGESDSEPDGNNEPYTGSSSEEDSDAQQSLEMPRTSRGSQTKQEANATITFEADYEPEGDSNWKQQISRGSFIYVKEDDKTLRHRALVIMAITSDDALSCISLCCHQVIPPSKRREHLKTHMEVAMSAQAANGSTSTSPDTVLVSFYEDQQGLCRVRERSYVNCENTYTVRPKTLLTILGEVANFPALQTKYRDVQSSLHG